MHPEHDAVVPGVFQSGCAIEHSVTPLHQRRVWILPLVAVRAEAVENDIVGAFLVHLEHYADSAVTAGLSHTVEKSITPLQKARTWPPPVAQAGLEIVKDAIPGSVEA